MLKGVAADDWRGSIVGSDVLVSFINGSKLGENRRQQVKGAVAFCPPKVTGVDQCVAFVAYFHLVLTQETIKSEVPYLTDQVVAKRDGHTYSKLSLIAEWSVPSSESRIVLERLNGQTMGFFALSETCAKSIVAWISEPETVVLTRTYHSAVYRAAANDMEVASITDVKLDAYYETLGSDEGDPLLHSQRLLANLHLRPSPTNAGGCVKLAPTNLNGCVVEVADQDYNVSWACLYCVSTWTHVSKITKHRHGFTFCTFCKLCIASDSELVDCFRF
jgi:hypothetical protein